MDKRYYITTTQIATLNSISASIRTRQLIYIMEHQELKENGTN
jgi:hypothetical protein